MRKIIKIFLISFFITGVLTQNCQAAFWHHGESLGNEIKKEEYPDSKDVEPKVDNSDEAMVIKGGVETTMDITLEECLKYALGNNPKIQAAMQDVFASDARIRETWAAYFPQFG